MSNPLGVNLQARKRDTSEGFHGPMPWAHGTPHWYPLCIFSLLPSLALGPWAQALGLWAWALGPDPWARALGPGPGPGPKHLGDIDIFITKQEPKDYTLREIVNIKNHKTRIQP